VRFAVVGDPIAHSWSPAIHRAAFTAVGIDAEYNAIRVGAGKFGSVVTMLADGVLDGVNVTMPLKTEAFQSVDVLGAEADATGAVNTVLRGDRGLVGENTDVDGVRASIARLELPEDTPVLVLGGGGAARAACVAIRSGPVWVSTRRPGGADAVLDRSGIRGATVPWGEPVAGAIVVNATPIGMQGEHLPAGLVEHAAGLVDMVYRDDPTPAVVAASAVGIPVSDGCDMLVGQAARAFELFVGRPAPLGVMEAAVRV
jgi:shikimate dehydrogenase